MILLHAAFSFNTHHWKSTIHSVIYLEYEINCGFSTILSATVHNSFILENNPTASVTKFCTGTL